MTKNIILNNHGIQNYIWKIEYYIWGISKIKAFSIGIFNTVLPLIGSTIYRELNCRWLI